MKRVIIGLLLICFICATVNAAVCSSQDTKIHPKGYKVSTIYLDSVPNGLSGYNLTINVSNGTIAKIDDVLFPSWATTSNCTDLSTPQSSCTITAGDLTDLVVAGDTNVQCCRVGIRGYEVGDTTLNITVNQMDDDLGAAISPTVSNGTVHSTSQFRVMTSATITTFSEERYDQMIGFFGGNTTANETNPLTFDIDQLPSWMMGTYTDVLGTLAIVLIFSLPFFMLYIIGKGIEVPTILGIFIGVYAISRLPAEYQPFAVLSMCMGITAIVYSLLKERV